ncbi:MAG: single-stranded DNA-binding protein [Chitinophagales bacterium]
MRGINKVILIGNLGKDPEIQRLESGAMVARFSVATTEVYKDKSGNRAEQTEWHNISVWNKQAEIAEKYLKKGSGVYIEGKIRTRDYTDKSGQQKRAVDILCDRFSMLDRKGDGAATSPSSSSSAAIKGPDNSDLIDEEPLDDLPF